MAVNLMTREQPLGPATLDDVRSRAVAASIYDRDNEIDAIYRKSSPVFLIGRRGSGKTAFLKAITSPEELIVDLNSPEVIAQCAKTIESLGITEYGEFAERIAALWEACFVAAACSRLWSKHSRVQRPDAQEAFDFAYQLRRHKDGWATGCVLRYLYALRTRLRNIPDYQDLPSLLDEVELNNIPLWVARDSLEAALDRKRYSILISMDSLDKYTGIFYEGGVLATKASFALQGLFRAASRRGRLPGSTIKVRVSFPAELWHFYSGFSANPLKDFDNCIALHWESNELLHIAATRFMRYLDQSVPREFRRVDASGPRWAQDLFLRYLPSTLENRMGREEPSLCYILRHTQLLPRHFIHSLNLIFRHRDLTPNCVTARAVRNAVNEAEVKAVNNVVSSYALVYPKLREICDALIPRLSLTFRDNELHHHINQINRYGMEPGDIVRMLIEVGAVGRVTETTSYYRKADFEYLHLSRMLVSPGAELCLHPLFTRVFESKAITLEKVSAAEIPIFPLGSDPTGPKEIRRQIHLSRE
jgi:hypothetical protein